MPLFQDNFILVEATSSHFLRVTTSTQQLLFWCSYFLRTADVFCFFRTVTLQELFFQSSFFFGAKILQTSHFVRIGSSLRQLLYWTAIFLEELFRIKVSKKELPFQSIYFCRASAFSEKLHFRKTDFSENQFRINYFFWRAVFLEQLLFQKTLPSTAATFSEELLSYNILFQESYYFTATVPFHSYTSYLFVSN